MEGNEKSVVPYTIQIPSLGLVFYQQINNMVQNYNKMFAQHAEMIINTLNSPMMNAIRETVEAQAKWAETIVKSINSPFFYPQPVQIQDAEIVDTTPSGFDLSVDYEGQFFFQNDLVKTITAGSKHGKFLIMLLTNDDNYVSDKEFRKEIDVADVFKGIGYIRRDLKRYLRNAGLEIEIRRIRKCGHKLLSIRRILN